MYVVRNSREDGGTSQKLKAVGCKGVVEERRNERRGESSRERREYVVHRRLWRMDSWLI